MSELEVLVRKAGTVDRLAARAVAACEIATLNHKVRNDSVEGGALIVQRLAGNPCALLAGAQRTEVLDGLGYRLAKQAENDASGRLVSNGDIKVDLVSHLGPLLLLLPLCRNGTDQKAKRHKCQKLHSKKKLKKEVDVSFFLMLI